MKSFGAILPECWSLYISQTASAVRNIATKPIASAARKAIQDMSDKQYIDIYLDKENERIVIEVNDSGEFALGKKLCLRSVSQYIADGRHDIEFTKGPEGQDWICMDFEG